MITILLPTDGKRIKELKYAVSCILNQEYTNIELIVLSSYNDLAPEILEIQDDRFKVVRVPEEHWGYWGHKAVKWAVNDLELKGEWLFIIGDDDVLCRWSLGEMIKNSEGVDMVHGLVIATTRDTYVWSNRILGATMEHGQITGECCIYRLSRVREVGYTEDKYEADWILIKDMMRFPHKQINSIITVMPCL